MKQIIMEVWVDDDEPLGGIDRIYDDAGNVIGTVHSIEDAEWAVTGVN